MGFLLRILKIGSSNMTFRRKWQLFILQIILDMNEKTFNGKAIRMPKGAAGEYGKYSCNLYVGCSNGCTYCYLNKPPFKKACGGKVPTLKKCFNDEQHALEIFENELKANLQELLKHGLFFTFTSDPFLRDTYRLTNAAIKRCLWNDVPVKVLTKMNVNVGTMISLYGAFRQRLAFGFTLTGHDDLEPNAFTNAQRIEAMKKLHDAGFKTWASIEPIIDFESSKDMIRKTAGFCDLYKIGLESGKKYDKTELLKFIEWCNSAYITEDRCGFYTQKNYFKNSLLKQAGINREDLPINCVTRDYNIFNYEYR